MNFKALFLLFLLFFASVGAIALVNLSIAQNNLRTATYTLRFGSVQPNGGDPIDNPRPS